jgi:hypothetical protein
MTISSVMPLSTAPRDAPAEAKPSSSQGINKIIIYSTV